MANNGGTADKKRPGGTTRTVKLLAAVVIIATVLLIGRILNLQDRFHALLNTIQGLGAPGYVVFFGLYVLSCVLFIPGSILTLGAGAIYGVVAGSILVSVSSTLGATAAFLVGRHLARDWVAAKISGNKTFSAIDDAVGKEGWKIVGLTRLSPVFPFSLLNYAYGLTKVRLHHYFFASWVGMLPGTIMYVYIGSLAKSLSAVAADCEQCERTPFQWALYGIGLLATVAVTVLVTRIARRALNEKIAEG